MVGCGGNTFDVGMEMGDAQQQRTEQTEQGPDTAILD
jgi:hypothetical protein